MYFEYIVKVKLIYENIRLWWYRYQISGKWYK